MLRVGFEPNANASDSAKESCAREAARDRDDNEDGNNAKSPIADELLMSAGTACAAIARRRLSMRR